MKTLVISDTHLTEKFIPIKYKYLNDIIKKSDTVIINGDFWDGYLTTFSRFVESPWNDLFPLLKSKHAIYVNGNHDKSILSDQRVYLFCDIQTTKHSLTENGMTMNFEHGNRLYPFFDDQFHLKRIPKPTIPILRSLHAFNERMLKQYGKKFLDMRYKKANEVIKKRLAKTQKQNEITFFGHTHYGEYDAASRYANSGFINHGFAQYLMINADAIQLHEEWYDR